MNDSVFNIVTTDKCNANCPYCISKQTPNVCSDFSKFSLVKLQRAIQYAEREGIQTCKITGKGGDPLCALNLLCRILTYVNTRFPIVEIQTNGILLHESYVKSLAFYGATIVAISCVDYCQKVNEDIYGTEYPELRNTVELLHKYGLTVRLSCTLIKNCIDCSSDIDAFLDYFEGYNVQQFSFIPVGWIGDNEYAQWAKAHNVNGSPQYYQQPFVFEKIIERGTLIWKTSYGGRIYDYKGRNVYIAECLTSPVEGIRSLIYYPDGRLRYSWTKPGAIIF